MHFRFFLALLISGMIVSCSPKHKFKPVTSLTQAQRFTNISTNQISALETHHDQYIWLQNVKALSFNQFQSSKGNQILKVKFVDQKSEQIEGIFFESDFTPATIETLAREKNYDVLIKVTTYKGKTSFIAKYINVPKKNIERDIATEGKPQ